MGKLLAGDRAVLSLLRTNPFPDRPPRYVRALIYEYHFTSPAERAATAQWWTRKLAGTYFRPSSLPAVSWHHEAGENGAGRPERPGPEGAPAEGLPHAIIAIR